MTAGQLRHKVTVQQFAIGSPQADQYGTPQGEWSSYAHVWAEITPLTGREYWDAQQVNPEISLRVRIRYLQGITPKMRILFGTRVIEIEAIVNEDQRGRYMRLLCSEVVGG